MQWSYLEVVAEVEDHPDHLEAVEVEEVGLVDFLKGVLKQSLAIYLCLYTRITVLSLNDQSIV